MEEGEVGGTGAGGNRVEAEAAARDGEEIGHGAIHPTTSSSTNSSTPGGPTPTTINNHLTQTGVGGGETCATHPGSPCNNRPTHKEEDEDLGPTHVRLGEVLAAEELWVVEEEEG